MTGLAALLALDSLVLPPGPLELGFIVVGNTMAISAIFALVVLTMTAREQLA